MYVIIFAVKLIVMTCYETWITKKVSENWI